MPDQQVEACLTHGRRLVCTGGCFDWGGHGADWIDEDTPLTPSPLGAGHAARAVDLAHAYVSAVTAARPGSSYAVVDDEPLPLKTVTDLVATAVGRGPVGHVPPAVIGLLLGRPLVQSLVTSFRIRADRARAELGWTPHHTARDAVPAEARALAAR